MPWTGTKLETALKGDGYFERAYESTTGHKIELWAEVTREGDTLHLRDLGVSNDIDSPHSGAAATGSTIRGFNERVPVGMRELAPALSQLASEAKGLGFKTLRITAHRITGGKIKNGKADTNLDIRRDLTKLAETSG